MATRVPSCEVIAGPGTAKEDRLHKKVRITSQVRALRTVKSMASPAGTFQLTCTYEPPPGFAGSLNRILVPGNTVEISLDAGLPDSTMETVMLGWVTNVEEVVTLNQKGQPQRTISVTGLDMGKFFLRHDLPGYLFTSFIMGDKEAASRLEKGLFISGIVGEVLRGIFLAIYQEQTPVPLQVLEEGQLITDPALDGIGDDSLLSYLSVDSLWTEHGKFWNVFTSYADRPWNEVFGDYIADPHNSPYGDYLLAKPGSSAPPFKQGVAGTLSGNGGAGYYLIARRSPFSKAKWDKLPTTTVFDSEIKLQKLKLSDDERINLVLVAPFGKGTRITGDQYADGAVFRSIYWDKDSTRRHGTQSLQTSSIYTDIGGDSHLDPDKLRDFTKGDDTDLTNAVRQRGRLLWEWYSVNHLLRKGIVAFAGNPSIRIGERIQHQSDGSSYYVEEEGERSAMYVEQVIQDYAEGSHYHTHVAVTRAQPRDHFVEADFAGAEIWKSDPAGVSTP